VLRILAGLFMAVEYTAGNTLLIEWLPLKEGSRFQSRLVVYWVIGFIAAYATSASLTGAGPRSWIYMMVAPAVPALLTAIFRSLAKLPTSPAWLVNQGHPEIAQRVIRKHLGKRFGLSQRQKQADSNPEAPSWLILFSAKYRRKTAVGGVFYGAQAFSFFGISIFLPILLKSMGVQNASFAGYLYNGSMLIGVILGNLLFNRIPRRNFLIGGFALSAILLLILAFRAGSHHPRDFFSCFGRHVRWSGH
jgi:putative MFS transporter